MVPALHARPVSPDLPPALESSVDTLRSANSSTWCFVVDGKHKGKRVRFVKLTAQRVGVQLPESEQDEESTVAKTIYLLPSHVAFSNDGTASANSVIQSPASTSCTASRPMAPAPRVQPKNLAPNTWVTVNQGKHKGKSARFVKYTAQRVAVQMSDGKEVYLLPSHIEAALNNSSGSSSSNTLTARTNRFNTEPEPATGNQSPPAMAPSPTLNEEENSFRTPMQAMTNAPGTTTNEDDEFASAIMVEGDDEEDINDFGFVSLLDRVPVPSTTAQPDDMSSVTTTTTFATATGGDVSAPAPITTLPLYIPGKRLKIYSGGHAGKMATFVKYTPKCVAVRLDRNNAIRYLSPRSLDPSSVSCTSSNFRNDVDDPLANAIRQAIETTTGNSNESVALHNCSSTRVHQTLFGSLFPDAIFFEISLTHVRQLAREVTVPSSSINNCHANRGDGNTTKLCLAATKFHQQGRTVTCAYLEAESCVVVAKRLQKVGALEKLIPRKTAARLELLLSTAANISNQPEKSSISHHIHEIQPSDVCLIDERGNDGCGFIPRRMIRHFLGSASDEKGLAAQTSSLQVRIVIPSIGVFKGMLAEKPGIDRIQLPPSMKKVDASECPSEGGFLLINKSGMFPHTARIQQADSGFVEGKVIAEMARWMLCQKGVSNSYLTQPNRQHANLVGEADPTSSIPSGCVFLPGIHKHAFPDKIILSRFPMTEASDGVVLPILKERPPAMSIDDWDFLGTKKFGSVVFGQPPPGQPSLPEQIAQSDLDGDEFFACWDPKIVADAVIGDRPIFASKNPPLDFPDDWWRESLDYMANIEARSQSQRLIGSLWFKWKQKLGSNSQTEAVMFGRAFKEALVVSKHGGNVALPKKMWDCVPFDMRKYLKEP